MRAITFGPKTVDETTRKLAAYVNWGLDPIVWLSRETRTQTNRFVEARGNIWLCRDALLHGKVTSVASQEALRILHSWTEGELTYEMMYAAVNRMQFDRIGSPVPAEAKHEYLYRLTAFWSWLIGRHDIEAAVWPHMPHQAWSLCLYKVARWNGLSTLIFARTGISDLKTVCRCISDRGRPDHAARPAPELIAQKRERNTNALLRNTTDAKAAAVDSLIARATDRSYRRAEPDYMKRQRFTARRRIFDKATELFEMSGLNLKRKTVSGWHIDRKGRERWAVPLTLAFFAELRKRRYLRDLYKRYCDAYNRSGGNGANAIVLFLHYQPECTTLPEAGPKYFSQERIVKDLLQAYPQDVEIHIREHPSTFYPSMRGELGRDLGYYRRMHQCSHRIKFIPLDIDPYTLIDHARAIVTATGTVGLEAAMRGTPAIVVGYAAYRSVARVYSVPDMGGFPTLEKLYELRQISNSEAAESLRNLSRTFYGDVFSEYAGGNSRKEEESSGGEGVGG